MPSVAYGSSSLSYRITRKLKLKHTYIIVDREGVCVKTNEQVDEETLAAYVIKRSAWISRKLKAYKAKALEENICTGARLYYMGKSYYVELIEEERREHISVDFTHARFVIHAPMACSQIALHHAVDTFYKRKAIEKITPLVRKWSQKMELTPDHLAFRKAEKRWGSCSATNRITLNYHLMKISRSLIEYVIVHELAHILHKNHSTEFWSVVKKQMHDYKQRAEKIKVFEKQL